MWNVYINWLTSVLACMHRPNDVGQLKEASGMFFTHVMWFVYIWKDTSDNGMHSSPVVCVHRMRNIDVGERHAPSSKSCGLLESDVNRRLSPSANAFKNLTRHVYIKKESNIYLWDIPSVKDCMHRPWCVCIT